MLTKAVNPRIKTYKKVLQGSEDRTVLTKATCGFKK